MPSASRSLAVSMIDKLMTKMRSLSDILASNDNSEELYHSENQRRAKRAQRGRFTKDAHTFDFIHLVKSWKEVVGEMLAQNTIPLKIKNNQLYILTKHAVFSQELSFMEQSIVQKIETIFPNFKGKIKRIRFSTGDFSSEQFNTLKNQNHKKAQAPRSQPNRFDPNYRKKLAQASELFKEVDDEEMKELLIQVYLAE